MRVLLIDTVDLGANGITTFIINVAHQMAKKDIDVTILAPNKVDTKLKKKIENDNIHLKEIVDRASRPISYFRRLKKYLKYKKFAVVHVNGNSTTMAMEVFAAKLAGVKKRIAHSHNTTTEHPFINIALRPLFEICVNERIACNQAAGKWLFKNKKFTIIPNGINLKEYAFNSVKRKKYRKKLKLKDSDILLGHVGSFNYQKNQIFLIDLIQKLPRKFKIILIGDGSEFKSVKDKVNKLHLTDRIIFTGVISNVSEYLNAMDLFLLPSNFEGQPFSLIEASANGLNCIVSDKVKKENDLVDNIKFISLDNKSAWCSEIENCDFSRKKTISKLTDMGYDYKKNSDKLVRFYKESI